MSFRKQTDNRKQVVHQNVQEKLILTTFQSSGKKGD